MCYLIYNFHFNQQSIHLNFLYRSNKQQSDSEEVKGQSHSALMVQLNKGIHSSF